MTKFYTKVDYVSIEIHLERREERGERLRLRSDPPPLRERVSRSSYMMTRDYTYNDILLAPILPHPHPTGYIPEWVWTERITCIAADTIPADTIHSPGASCIYPKI